MSDEEKTHDPTDKKIEDSRKKGDVPKSQEVNGFVVLLVGTFTILAISGYMLEKIQVIFVHFFKFTEILDNKDFTAEKTVEVIKDGGGLYFEVIWPVFSVIFLFAIIANVVQFGLLLNPLKLDFSKLNPINGIKNIFGLKKLVEMFKMTMKIIVGIFIFLIIIFWFKDGLANLGLIDIYSAIDFYDSFVLLLFSVIMFSILIFAIVDLVFVRHNYFNKLKMSEKEVRDEYKQMEGDPQVKQRIKEMQYKLATGTLMQDVKTADFIVTNPTHYAVALRYDSQMENAPRVVAKGEDHLALQIKLIARENEIPIVENVKLARSLYSKMETNEEITEDFYKAVADLFRFVAELKSK